VDDLDLQSRKIAALPIIDQYLRRLGVQDMLSGRMDGGGIVSHTDCMMILLKNIILEREPLYGIAKWVTRFESSLLGLSPDQLVHVNDDRIGRMTWIHYLRFRQGFHVDRDGKKDCPEFWNQDG